MTSHISEQFGDRERLQNTVMLIYRHDMSSGLQYVSISTSF